MLEDNVILDLDRLEAENKDELDDMRPGLECKLPAFCKRLFNQVISKTQRKFRAVNFTNLPVFDITWFSRVEAKFKSLCYQFI